MGVQQISAATVTPSIPVNLGRGDAPPHGRVYVYNMCDKERTGAVPPLVVPTSEVIHMCGRLQ
jgi:hypothetical protein